jgi:diguanylate cyclase (GGDEF)-like protein
MNLTLDKLLAVVSALPDPVFILTESGKYAAIFGGGDVNYYHDGSGLAGSSLYDVLPADKADAFLAQVKKALREKRLIVTEYGLAGSDVEGLDTEHGPEGEIWFEGRVQPLPFLIDDEQAVVWTARNITQRYRLEEELRRRSETDELTGAGNRRKLIEELELKYREFRRYGTPLSLLMLDVDHFKRINDQYGHVVGDEVLRDLVDCCKQQLREVDLFSRFGGEEFVALLPHTGLDEASETAERLRQAIEQNVTPAGEATIQVTISIGVSTLGQEDRSYESVLTRIDDALYEAKRAGRNCVRSAR